MHPQQNSSDFAFGGHWPHQAPISNQPESQFLAPSTHYGKVEDGPHQALSYSFVPLVPSFGLGDSSNNPPSIRSSLSAPLATAFTAPVQSTPTSSTVGSRFPPLQNFSKTGSSQSDQSYERPIHPPPRPRKSMPRTLTLTPSAWEKHHGEIKKLWIDENKTLPETMKIMADNFGFEPSVEQYKKQLKKWNWSKYLPAKEVFWMENKAAKRKREEKKDTIFDYRGQTYTKQSLQSRLQKRKNQEEEATISADAPTPSDIVYTTPHNDATSPLYIVSPKVSAQQPRWTPAPTSHTQHPHHLNLLWNGHSKTDFDAVYHEAQELERLARIEDAENKFREALTGFENLFSATHEDTIAVAYRLASFYAQNDRMKDADAVLDWMTEKHIERFGDRCLETIEHLLHVVEMFRNWSRNEDAKAFLSRMLDVLKEAPKHTQDEATRIRSSNSFTTSDRFDGGQTRTIPHQPQSSSDRMRTTDSNE
ncbi:hypothetical protein G7Y89_g12275 [Cudoniella acicularis]|uniref:Clr5 domain-containing protein n=1 Tax=Cudoniella acicularis TaxID=354080 RepID=A0A8H4VX64_9HELO|nr:hypothetical protein G7Y89_g12275 [Cudoniella acicularis]